MENAKKIKEEALDFLYIHRESRKIILKEEQRAVKELISRYSVHGFWQEHDLHDLYLGEPRLAS